MSARERLHVLVVDDEEELSDLIAEHLSARGYACHAVSSSREALRRLRTERVDALVTDVHMPGLDGLALLRASVHLDPSRPVILMTAYEGIGTAMQANGEGAYKYLVKPFRLEELVKALERALHVR